MDILTVHLEDYFQVGTLRSLVSTENWYQFDPRVEENTLKALDLLDTFGLKVTFFALGWVAEHHPHVVREVVRRGHEVASKGYFHRSIREMTPNEFREDLLRSKAAIERATGKRIYGYRTARGWLKSSDRWVLDILAEEDFVYDSSVRPLFYCQSHSSMQHIFQYTSGKKQIWEFPLSSYRFLGLCLPIAGGNYFRQIPEFVMRWMVARWHKNSDDPFIMYFHIWELDPNQPRIQAAPLFQRIRQYRNLEKMSWLIPEYLKCYKFQGIADYLQLPREDIIGSATHGTLPPIDHREIRLSVPTDLRTIDAVTLVIPCYNEEQSLPYLANTLQRLQEVLGDKYALHYCFVDDGSKDSTYEVLQRLFGSREDCTISRQPQNMGVAAAIMTGIRNAKSEIVCSLDCDCTYDPHQLANMIPLLTDQVDLVTASPYHPLGRVLNVPWWRLTLSKSLSMLYGMMLPTKLSTYTSCFRVYRKSHAEKIHLEEGGFLGVAELIARMNIEGFKIVEYPAVLQVRLLGQSKMKIIKTIWGHILLLGRIYKIKQHKRAELLMLNTDR